LSEPIAEVTAASSARTPVIIAVRLVVSVTLLALLFSRMDVGGLVANARQASLPWLLVALVIYFAHVLASTWRWRVLLDAQSVHVPRTLLLSSYLVAIFFNNFLPSNIGGDVIRITDTAPRARSKTLATTVILVDRGLGVLGLVLVAAIAATIVGQLQGHVPSPIWPVWLWTAFIVAIAVAVPLIWAPTLFGRLLKPVIAINPAWIGERIEKLTAALQRFRDRPGALAECFVGALCVQALLIAYHLAVVFALHIPIGIWDLAVIVPISFVVQMVPVSLNGFGVREATFSLYFTRVGLPMQSGVLVSLGATVVMMIFSLSGAALYLVQPSRQ
jgi:glycosyltransferase 2 family protein